MDTLHLKAPGNWLNDPNGFIYFKGQYHLFYQHFPFATRWGTMHWGHAVSKDLIHWEHLGVAVFPTKSFDANGVFSGSAFEVNDEMLVYYTGVRYNDYDHENCHIALNDVYECTQVMMASPDGMTFDNYNGKKVVLPVIYDDDVANFNHTRDPKVWEENGRYYMVLGSTFKMKKGRVIILQSDDAKKWEIKSVLTDKKLGRILECPDIFRIGGRHIFLGSLVDIVPGSAGYTAQTMIGTVDFDPETCQLSNLGEFEFIDHGRDLYAPQTCIDEDGRRVMVAWLRMPEEAKMPSDRKPWNGMMCVPRVIDYADGCFNYRIHPNVLNYFDQELTEEEKKSFKASREKPWLMETAITNGDSIDIGGYKIWMENDTLHTNRDQVFVKGAGLPNSFTLPAYSSEYKLSIIVEPNIIEIYVDNGKYCLTNAVYNLRDQLTGRTGIIFVSSEE